MRGKGLSSPSINRGRACQGAAESTLFRSIQYCSLAGFRPQVMWKWFAGAYCLYSSMLAYLGTTKVCGHVEVEVWQTASESFSGRSTVTASSQTSENMSVRLL